MKLNFDELILSSGGMRGIIFIGALIKLDSIYPLKNFKYLTGSSVGSIILTMISIGYNLLEIKYIITRLEFENFQELKIRNLLNDSGLDDGKKFNDLLQALFETKNIPKDITFLQLYNINKKILTLNTANMTSGLVEYMNFRNTPNLSVLKALRMSSNIPILFTPILYNNSYYIDGALLDPYPYDYFKNTTKLGLYIVDNYEYNFFLNKDVKFIEEKNNFLKYFTNIIKLLYTNYLKNKYKIKKKNTIYFNLNIENMTFSMDLSTKKSILTIGEKTVNKYFKKLYTKLRKVYLSKKYYFIWKSNVFSKLYP